jgi:hypothetical protein
MIGAGASRILEIAHDSKGLFENGSRFFELYLDLNAIGSPSQYSFSRNTKITKQTLGLRILLTALIYQHLKILWS